MTDEGVVSGLVRSREVERDTALISPEVEIAGDKLCALIDCRRPTPTSKKSLAR
jgi:hypothetical protein